MTITLKKLWLALGVGLVALTASCASSAKTPNLGTHIKLTRTANTRDLGGIKTKNGLHIRQGRLFRSDALTNLTHHDRLDLQKKHDVKAVIDFRSKPEIKQRPDSRISGARLHQLNILSNLSSGRNRMPQYYRQLVTDKQDIRAYRSMFKILLQQKQGAVLYHCTYGKDRTGIATMLILSSLGVPKTTIMKNYLASNRYLSASKLPQYKKGHWTPVRSAYLNAAYSAIDQRSGSMKQYLNSEMHLSTTNIQKLRTRYLTK